MSILSKIRNPKAGSAQIVLALVYLAIITALLAGAFIWQFAFRAADVGIAEKIPF